MTLLSLCMIVRDEEDVLQRCLESVKDLADEIVIVDTGSTDRTKEIARQYTDKIFDFEWTNSFADARNESLRHATGKWILVLDADEYVQDEGKQELREFLEKTTPDNSVFMLPILNIVGDEGKHRFIESHSTRLFPNHRGIHYTRPIHEQLTASYPFVYKKYNFYIYHTGYISKKVNEKQKSERNWNIFRNVVGSSSLDPFYSFCIGNEYRRDQDYKKALYHYEKAYKKGKPGHAWFAHCLEAMISIQLNMNRITDAYKLIAEGVRIYPNHPDFICYEGIVLHHFGFHEQAIQRYESCIRLADQLGNRNQSVCLVSPDYAYAIPFEKLSAIYTLRMDMHKMVYYYVKQLQTDPAKTEIAVKLALLLSRSEPPQSVQAFFEKNFFNNSLLTDQYKLFRIFLVAGIPQLAMQYFEQISSQNVELSPLETCRLAILTKSRSLYEQAAPKMSDAAEAAHYSRIAGLIWENRSAADTLQELQGNEEQIARILNDLFDLQCYESFDQVMAQVQSPAPVEMVAQHFFARGEWDLAYDIYQQLEKLATLKASSYESLYYICRWKNENQKALSYIKQAIEHEPEELSRYGLLFEVADHASIQEYKQQFFSVFPQYRKLPFITAL